MARPKVRTDALRQHVLRTASALLHERGEDAFTTRRVAQHAGTSPPAIYEFFGDKRGLLRAVVFDAFRMLGDRLTALPRSEDPCHDVEATVHAFRAFALDHPNLSTMMFSQALVSFAPTPDEMRIAGRVRGHIVGGVQRCIDEGVLDGDATDIAHGVLALAMGLATQERAGWLGSRPIVIKRRWSASIRGLLAGFTVDQGGTR